MIVQCSFGSSSYFLTSSYSFRLVIVHLPFFSFQSFVTIVASPILPSRKAYIFLKTTQLPYISGISGVRRITVGVQVFAFLDLNYVKLPLL